MLPLNVARARCQAGDCDSHLESNQPEDEASREAGSTSRQAGTRVLSSARRAGARHKNQQLATAEKKINRKLGRHNLNKKCTTPREENYRVLLKDIKKQRKTPSSLTDINKYLRNTSTGPGTRPAVGELLK